MWPGITSDEAWPAVTSIHRRHFLPEQHLHRPRPSLSSHPANLPTCQPANLPPSTGPVFTAPVLQFVLRPAGLSHPSLGSVRRTAHVMARCVQSRFGSSTAGPTLAHKALHSTLSENHHHNSYLSVSLTSNSKIAL